MVYIGKNEILNFALFFFFSHKSNKISIHAVFTKALKRSYYFSIYKSRADEFWQEDAFLKPFTSL